MSSPDPLRDFELLLRSRYGLIAIETVEEDRVEALACHVADRLDLPLFLWTRTKGLRRLPVEGEIEPSGAASDVEPRAGRESRGRGARTVRAARPTGEGAARRGGIYGTLDPGGALDHIEAARYPGLYLLQGLGPELGEATFIRKLKDAAAIFAELPGAVVLSGAELPLSEELRPTAADLSLPPPGIAELRGVLRRTVHDLRKRDRIQVELSAEAEERLLRALRGLTLMEAEKAITRAIVEDGRLDEEDLRHVVAAKRELVERQGLLEFHPAEEKLAEVADLAALKDWLAKREVLFRDPERAERFGLPFPRGILLLGVPGCGKSLCAKAVANGWGLPLLRLDPSSLYNKYLGESERNFRRAISLAERLAPVVLFLDEMEKAFALAGEADGGVSLRILGTFLAWLQDRRGDVFVVATANDVTRLPPEFLRKGRFDEIFFVDLPDGETRRRIFEIHLSKRGLAAADFDLRPLGEATAGFSGSEIEQVVVSALYTAASLQGEVTTHLLLREVERTHPLSHTMAERIEALRRWARNRTVSAQ